VDNSDGCHFEPLCEKQPGPGATLVYIASSFERGKKKADSTRLIREEKILQYP
jgi:hypothetical protein